MQQIVCILQWKSWEEVGIEELFDTCYHVSVVDANSFISETITPMKLTPAELKALTPAIQVFSDPSVLQKVTQDARIYIEACVAHKQLRGNVVMLVKDDHQFFQCFAMSVIAENLLVSQVLIKINMFT